MTDQVNTPATFGQIIEAEIIDEVKKTKQKKSDVPQREIEFYELSVRVNNKWAENKELYQLAWMTQEDFAVLVENFATAIKTGGAAGDTRKTVTELLRELDDEILKVSVNIKNYLFEEYGLPAARAYYTGFGFEKKNGSYRFPTNRESRKNALVKICDSIEKHGFSDRKYGLTYWRDIEQKYSDLYLQSMNKTGTVSMSSGTKSQMRKQIRRVLTAIKYLIKANNPDTWAKEYRVWGFQREKI